MSKPIRVIQFGLGAIGRATARLVLKRNTLQLAGAVDPQFAGRDLGEVLGWRRKLNLPVRAELAGLSADAVLHCTGSHFDKVFDQLTAIARAGLHCVSSCEEGLLPSYRHPALAKRLHQLCVAHHVGFVGTGVNPGFVMDTLALVLTAPCQRVDALRIRRVVNAGTRREALQRKVGAGMSPAEFRVRVGGHVGLTESLALVADGLGWKLDRVTEQVAPVRAARTVRTRYLTVNRGAVAGVHQVARGYRGGRAVLTLDLQMYVGAPAPRDEIEIRGDPPLHVVVAGGTPGDVATPAMLVNLLPVLVAAAPGLHTMKTLTLPHGAR